MCTRSMPVIVNDPNLDLDLDLDLNLDYILEKGYVADKFLDMHDSGI